MTCQTRRSLAALAAAIGLPLSMASGPVAARTAKPDVPATLEPPAGYVLFLKTHAVGTQNYVCLPSGNAYAWRFIAPQATLFNEAKGAAGAQQLATHFLSPNPDEAGAARPTWQHAFDTSRVWARAIASSTDPAYVEAGAIAWLLLERTGAERGQTGAGFLAQTDYIQRINTSGGAAPSTGCAASTDVGALALVPYETDYYFYRARHRR